MDGAIVENRRRERHRLAGLAVRARLLGPRPARGRVRDLSESGGFYLELAPLPARTRVVVTLAFPDGRELVSMGQVARSDAHGMAVLVELDPIAERFLGAFVAAARAPEREGGLELSIEPCEAPPSELALSRAWLGVLEAPTDRAAHQRLIDACLGARRLDFAVAKLRATPALGEEGARSLAQLGAMLDFVAHVPKEREPSPWAPWLGRLALVLAALGALAFIAATVVVAKRATAHASLAAPSSSALTR